MLTFQNPFGMPLLPAERKLSLQWYTGSWQARRMRIVEQRRDIYTDSGFQWDLSFSPCELPERV